MTDWAFRLRFRMPRTSGLSVNDPSVDLQPVPGVGRLRLEAWPRGSGGIDQAEWLVVSGSAPSEAEAVRCGQAIEQALLRSFARLRVAADFGERAPKGRWTDYGKSLIKDDRGRPVLDDEHGLMFHKAEPTPRFVSVGAPTLKVSAQLDRLRVAVGAALRLAQAVTDQERIAYDLFSASYFDASPDARLISLVSALETLIDPPERSPAARSHVESLIGATREATLSSGERDSLISSLRWLLKESITATGAHFVRTRLGDRSYGDHPADRLWRTSYDLRSRLVHGTVPRPSREEVGRHAANLEVMVADLLSGDLLHVDV